MGAPFFIAGYPKCGTTSLYAYLKDHSGVFLPDLKEPHFFTTDRPGARAVESQAEYQALYRDANPSQLKGDASASVIHSDVALDRILAWNPAAKFIVIVREPVAAVRSFHGELLHNLNEDVEDFEAAWRLQPARAQGQAIPETCREPMFLQYEGVFRYRDQLPDFFDKIPAGQRFVLVFEEFFADPRAGYLQILEFLGLEDDGRCDFGVVNSARRHRFRSIAKMHRKLVDGNSWLYRTSRRTLSLLGIHPSHILSRVNRKPGGKAEISPSFEAELRRHFQEDVSTVERLLGRKIERWRK